MKKTLLSVLALVLVFAITCPIGVSAAKKKDLVIGLVVMSTSSEYWLGVKAGAEAALEKVGGKLIYTGPKTTNDVAEQVAAVENLIIRRVDGILLTPLDSDALVAPSKQAVRAGIPLVSIDANLNWDGKTSYVGTDNREGGRIAMELLIKAIGGEGKVAILNCPAGVPSNDIRGEAAVEVAKKYPKVELLEIQRGEDQAAAMANMERILNANPDLKGVFAAFDRAAIGGIQALRNRGLAGKIKVVAYDASPEEIEALEKGEIHGLVVQQPYLMGYRGVEYLLAAREGKEVPKDVFVPITVVTKENMNEVEVQKVLYPAK